MIVSLLLAAALTSQAPAAPPVADRPILTGPYKTAQARRDRNAALARARAAQQARDLKAQAEQAAYIEKMRPYWTAVQFEQARLAMQQQHLALEAYNAESLRRSAVAAEKSAKSLQYGSMGLYARDPVTGRWVPSGTPALYVGQDTPRP